MNDPRRILITGLGVVTGFGFGWHPLWNQMLAGRHCIRPWQPPGCTDFPIRFAAPADLGTPPLLLAEHATLSTPLEPYARLGLSAALLAMADAGLQPEHGRHMGVWSASGAPHHLLEDMALAFRDDSAAPSWTSLMRHGQDAALDGTLRQPTDRLARLIALELATRGPVVHVTSACAGAAQAIGNAFHALRRGECDIALAGGADSVLNLDSMASLHLLGAASTETRWEAALCRPFDIARSGLVAGEGGGFTVLETAEHATARGATAYAEVLGYGSSMDAYRLTAPDPEGRGIAQAITEALDDAGISPESVDAVNAHGTSTPLNDRAETLALKRAFARNAHHRHLSISANKSQFGHLIAAAGAVEAIVTALSCRSDWVPPTLNLDHPDPDCDLDYTPHHGRHRPVRIAISNSLGFGGLNATLVIGKSGGSR